MTCLASAPPLPIVAPLLHATAPTPTPMTLADRDAAPRPLSHVEAMHVLRRRAVAHVVEDAESGAAWRRVAYAVDDDALYACAWRGIDVTADAPLAPVELFVNDFRDLASWCVVRVRGRLAPLLATGSAQDRLTWRHAVQLLRPQVPAFRQSEASVTASIVFRVSLDIVVGVEQPLGRAD